MKKLVMAILIAVLASGCATVTRGTSEAFAIESIPPGASAMLSNGLTCITPCSIKVKRRGEFTVNIEKDGYEPVVATVTSSIDGAGGAGMAGNVLVGGIIGAGIDAGSGAMHSHKPNPLSVTLTKLDDPSINTDSAQLTSGTGADPLGMSVGSESGAAAAEEPSDQSGSTDSPLDMTQ